MKLVKCWDNRNTVTLQPAALFTDASQAALGAICYAKGYQPSKFAMTFDEDFARLPIHYKELKAILAALEKFQNFLKNKKVILFCDNQVVVWCFKNFGSKKETFNKMYGEILKLADNLNCSLQAVWIGTKFQMADRPSRIIATSQEFLPRILFYELQKITGIHFTLDAMATESNAKCPIYVSWQPEDKKSLIFDFFNLRHEHVKGHKIYIFPPRKLLAQVINHVLEKFQGITVVVIFHKWAEWPVEIINCMNRRNVNVIQLPQHFLSLIPTENLVLIKGVKYYGTPIKTYHSMAALIFSHKKRKF